VGFKDGGGVNKPAQARVKVTTTGGVVLQCGTTELGQGATTALCQVVAEVLAVPLDRVRYAAVDTDSTPFDQGTNASSAIAVMGRAVELAARDARRAVLEFAAAQLGCGPADLVLENWTVRRGEQRHPLAPLVMRHFGGTGFEFVGHGYFKMPIDHAAPLEARCAFWEIGWGGAEVEVDEETGQIRVLQLVVSGDAGRVIHPGACRGQDEGAAVMALGQALFERMLYDGARLVNGDPAGYRVALAGDLPVRFESFLQEQGHGPGPFGAKGLGEGAMLPVASAIANALEDAVGVRVTELPLSPERVLAALEAARHR
jgi:CO/xanthine dehydrogenase Mo-binding subunit